MIVGSRRKQRGALRTHDSAGETPPQTKHKGEVGGSQKDCGRQQLSVSLADGERNTKGRTVRTSIHWDENTGDLRSNLPIPQPPTGAPPQHGVSALPSHASSSRSPTRPPEGVPAGRED